MKKVFILALLSTVVLSSCGKSDAEIQAEKIIAEKRIEDSLEVAKLRTDSIEKLQNDLNELQARRQADSIASALNAALSGPPAVDMNIH
jgi:fumarylacetoacetate (FAA) hydrolase family protein